MSVKDILIRRLNVKNGALKPVSGGDINDAYELLSTDAHFFIKSNDAPQSFQMFTAEAKGLLLMKEKAGIKTPSVIDCFEENGCAFLVLDWISMPGNTGSSQLVFWEQLARLHQTSNSFFGLDHDNFIGTLPQINQASGNWLDFYYQNRIDFQLKLAVNSGLMDGTYHKKADRMFKQVEAGLPIEKPALIHGDLWSGNLIFDQSGQPVFIDPAVCYGSREMDLAMMKLFGGFGGFREFEVYDDLFPIDNHWKERISFYQLYYILVHVNLFGYSYVPKAQNIINYYGSRME